MAYQQNRPDPLTPGESAARQENVPQDPLVHPTRGPERPVQTVSSTGPRQHEGDTGSRSSYPPATGATATVPHPDHPEIENERDDRESAAVQHEVDRTRAQMDETIDTLADRLRPGNLLGDVLDWVATPSHERTSSDNTEKAKRAASRAGSTAWEKIRANPIPSALIGAGIAYLFLKGDDDPSPERIARHSAEPPMYGGSYVDARTGRPYDVEHYGREQSGASSRGFGGRLREYGEEAAEKARHAAEAAKRGFSQAAETAGDAARSAGRGTSRAGASVASGTSSAASATGDAASEYASRAGEYASRAGDYASDYASRAGEWATSSSHAAWDAGVRQTRQGYLYSRQRFETGVEEYPLAMSVAALAAGVLAGLAFPRSRTEDRLYGEQAHRMKADGAALARETMDRGRAVAEAGLEAAQEEAERRGITPESLKAQASEVVEHAKEAATHVAQSATDAARSEARDVQEDVKGRGLNPSGLAEDAKAVASEAAAGANDEARTQKEEAKSSHGAGS